jgi:hypothetical protein
MSDEGFLRRWARRKTEVRVGREPLPALEPDVGAAAAPVVVADAEPQPQLQPRPPAAPQPAAERPPPTMDDVATLDKDSDFSAFVARGVDQAVRRGALKKLFADPHFNVMDRLDVYIDDYTKPSPVSDAMLASLEHAKSVFLKMVEEAPAKSEQPPEQETQ